MLTLISLSRDVAGVKHNRPQLFPTCPQRLPTSRASSVANLAIAVDRQRVLRLLVQVCLHVDNMWSTYLAYG